MKIRILIEAGKIISQTPVTEANASARTFKTGVQQVDIDDSQLAAFIARRNLTPLPDPALVAAKTAKLAALQKAYSSTIAAGYHDDTLNASFHIDDASITEFHRLATKLQLSGTADDAQVSWGDAPYVINGIVNTDGLVHSLTFGDYKAFLDRLSDYYGGAKAKQAILAVSVNNATTVDEVNAVA